MTTQINSGSEGLQGEDPEEKEKLEPDEVPE